MYAGVLSVLDHLPHFEFLDDSNIMLNVAFAGVLGGSTGILLFVITVELFRYFDEE
jgi:hypothetical protein